MSDGYADPWYDPYDDMADSAMDTWSDRQGTGFTDGLTDVWNSLTAGASMLTDAYFVGEASKLRPQPTTEVVVVGASDQAGPVQLGDKVITANSLKIAAVVAVGAVLTYVALK